MVPAAGTQGGRVAEAALDLIAEHDRLDQRLSTAPRRFGRRERGRYVVARMRRLFGEISIIVVEIADRSPIGEGGEILGRAMRLSQESRS